MGEEIEIRDINGNMVRVYTAEALMAVGKTLSDDESLLVPRPGPGPLKYVKACLIDDSEVPG